MRSSTMHTFMEDFFVIDFSKDFLIVMTRIKMNDWKFWRYLIVYAFKYFKSP